MNRAKTILTLAGMEPASRPQLVFDHPNLRFPDKLNVTEEVLDRRIHEGRGDKVAVLYEDRKITYRELYESVNRFGNGLRALGVQQGDLVILRVPNRPEFIVCALAIHKIGAVPVPTMMLLRERTLTRIANKSRARYRQGMEGVFWHGDHQHHRLARASGPLHRQLAAALQAGFTGLRLSGLRVGDPR